MPINMVPGSSKAQLLRSSFTRHWVLVTHHSHPLLVDVFWVHYPIHDAPSFLFCYNIPICPCQQCCANISWHWFPFESTSWRYCSIPSFRSHWEQSYLHSWGWQHHWKPEATKRVLWLSVMVHILVVLIARYSGHFRRLVSSETAARDDAPELDSWIKGLRNR